MVPIVSLFQGLALLEGHQHLNNPPASFETHAMMLVL